MFRNQYDTDVTVWSPEGRLLQVEYAMESVKQGSACVGLRSDKAVVLGALKRSVSELSDFQKKIMEIDDHLGIAISGLTADARTLAKWMRSECLNHKYVYGTSIQSNRLVEDLADRHQECTQTYVRRPYGVGLLVASYDVKTGPHLYQTCPSGNYYEYYANSIGARNQSAKTYLEKHLQTFPACDLDTLIMHGLRALAGTVGGDGELNKDNGSIAYIDEGGVFTVIEDDDLKPYLDRLNDEAGGGDAGGGGGGGSEGKDDNADDDDAMQE